MNEQNLVRPSDLPPEKRKEMGRKGGIKSGKTRRKKADLRKAFETILTTEVPDKELANYLESLGFENTYLMAMVLNMTQKAINGDVKAFEQIVRLTASKDKYDIQEQKLRIDSMKPETDKQDNEIKVVIDYGDS